MYFYPHAIDASLLNFCVSIISARDHLPIHNVILIVVSNFREIIIGFDNIRLMIYLPLHLV